MAKNDNLTDFLTDIANAIRTKKGTSGTINPQNFSAEINDITGGGYDITVTDNADGTQSLAIVDGQGGESYFTSTIGDGSSQLSGIAKAITSIPSDITISGTSCAYMFNYCTSLPTIPLLDTSSVTSMSSMFHGCQALTTIPLLDTSSVTNMGGMFYQCLSLTSIPALDTSNVTSMANMFYRCSNLETILMTGMKVNFDISASTKFTADALVTILNNLATVTTTQTLTMGTTNLAKLTQAQKDIALNRGWTLA